jgi:hypothetical protein
MARESPNLQVPAAEPACLVATTGTAVGPMPVPTYAPMDIADDDWDDLLMAVKDRLRLTVGERPIRPGEVLKCPLATIQASVLECVAALGQLQLGMKHSRERRQRLEAELAQAQAALRDARGELISARA